jgi:carbohydrate kinase (thermoresistant glucokinase family)
VVIVVMGVSGAGKTTVGRALARRLGWPFHEGDDLHPELNVRKMQRDEPLTDEDRRPWLEKIRELTAREASRGAQVVVTCSCLKKAYRDLVRGPAGADVQFVYLAVDRDTAVERVGGRPGHFFDESLVASQFDALEPPRLALTLDATLPVEELVDAIVNGLGLARATRSRGTPPSSPQA